MIPQQYGVAKTLAAVLALSPVLARAFDEVPALQNADPTTAMGKTQASHSFGVFGGQTLNILGSNDVRRGFGFYYSAASPEPRLKLWSTPAQLAFEVGADTTYSNGFQTYRNNYGAVYGLPYARYRFHRKNGIGTFLDLGFGLYYTHISRDLNSSFSTMPTLDYGLAFPKGPNNEVLVGLRYRHISNGGTRGPNAGQNGLWLFAEYRY